jgi:transposase
MHGTLPKDHAGAALERRRAEGALPRLRQPERSAGKSIGEASELVGFHRNWVRTFLKRYNEQGPDAVADQHQLHPGGREPYLTPEQQQELEQAIARPAPDGGLWTGPKVSAWIAERTGRRIYPQLGWAYLQKLGFVRREPRPQHQDVASAAEQAAWKKN